MQKAGESTRVFTCECKLNLSCTVYISRVLVLFIKSLNKMVFTKMVSIQSSMLSILFYIQDIPGDIVQLVCAMPSAGNTCAHVILADGIFDLIFQHYFPQVSYAHV